MKKDVQISVRIPTELRDKLRELAEADRRPMASYIAILLEQHVAAKNKKR